MGCLQVWQFNKSWSVGATSSYVIIFEDKVSGKQNE